MRFFLVIGLVAAMGLTCFAGETASLFDGNVTFDLPGGMTAMSREDLLKKYPQGNPPLFAYATEDGTVSIAVTLSDSPVRPNQLEGFKQFMERSYDRVVPGIRWVKRDMVQILGRKWARIEFVSRALDTGIHNIIMITSYQNKPLMFNFNATVEKYADQADALEACILSLIAIEPGGSLQN